MKVNLICVGKTEFDFVAKGVDLYAKRMAKYLRFEVIYIKDIKKTKAFPFKEIKDKEGELILNKIRAEDFNVLLDENGKQYSSNNFASFIQSAMNVGYKNLNFVIGGAYGFSDKVYAFTKNNTFSLSKMTFSHQIIRLIFMEQIYRAMTILNNEPYHHQ